MEFTEVVRKRRMVRHFTPEPAPPEVLERIVEAARHAPSTGFSQGVSFVLVTDAATRRRAAEIAGEAEYVASGMHPFISEAPARTERGGVTAGVCTPVPTPHCGLKIHVKVRGLP